MANWFLSNEGTLGYPVSGKNTASVCCKLLKIRYSLISSLITKFSFDISGLSLT